MSKRPAQKQFFTDTSLVYSPFVSAFCQFKRSGLCIALAFGLSGCLGSSGGESSSSEASSTEALSSQSSVLSSSVSSIKSSSSVDSGVHNSSAESSFELSSAASSDPVVVVSSSVSSAEISSESSSVSSSIISVSSQSEASQSAQSSSEAEERIVIFALNSGGRSTYTAKDGTKYTADTQTSYFTGGSTGSTQDAIANTDDDVLYQTERWGEFSYNFPVPEGEYDVTLHFNESYFGPQNAGNRVFDVEIEGALLVNDLDPLAVAGHDVAYDLTFSAIDVSDGSLDLDFIKSVDNASVSGIRIVGPASAKPDEQTGGGEPTTEASVSCQNSSALMACLDFEDGSTGDFSGASGALRVVDGEEAFSGTQALKVTGQGFIERLNFPGTHWGRMMYKNTSKPNFISNYSHTTLLKGEAGSAQFRFIDTVAAPNGSGDEGFYQHLYNTEPNDLSLEGPYNNQFNGEWVCIEWSMDVAKQEYRLFKNGLEIALANGGVASNATNLTKAKRFDGAELPMTPVPETLDSLKIGMQNYQGHSYEYFIDDIAIGFERLTCSLE